MSYPRSRAEQLTEHLRECIRHGRLVEPLPGTRAWSKRLGVSRTTLEQAVRQLRRAGLISVIPLRVPELLGAASQFARTLKDRRGLVVWEALPVA